MVSKTTLLLSTRHELVKKISIILKLFKIQTKVRGLPRVVSLTIPTDTSAAFALMIKSLIVSGLSDTHPGGTTGRES